jgi:methylated-DNA-[protein]-cysteine S-methyltransferase
MTNDTMERALTGWLLGDAPRSAALAAWLATDEGRRALTAQRRVLRAVDVWGSAIASGFPRRHGPRRVTSTPTAAAVYYGSIATPLGPVLAAVGPRGLVGVSFARSARTFRAGLAQRVGGAVVRADARLARVGTEVAEYLRGTRRRFDLPIDLANVSDFQRRVLTAARRIPRGRVASYGEIARRIGQPGASRAVGQALGKNPIPIVIPCHRVVASAGKLGGYVGGTARKQKLLALEGAMRTGTWS